MNRIATIEAIVDIAKKLPDGDLARLEETAKDLQRTGETKEDRLSRIARKMIQVRRAVSTLQDYHMLDKYIKDLERIVGEGEREEDTLYKTAKLLIDFAEEYGLEALKARFFVGEPELAEYRRVVEEGEGNPHQWPGVEKE